MISADLRFEGFDARSWTNLVGLFAPQVISRLQLEMPDHGALEVREDGAPVRRGTLVVILGRSDERVLKAFHSTRGRVEGLEWLGPDRLETLGVRHGAQRVLVLREGVLEEIGERAARRLERGQDYLTQLLVLLRIVREVGDAGLLRLHPRSSRQAPIPTTAMVRRAIDLVLPDERAMVWGVFEGGRLWTAAVVRRRRGAIDLVAGPERLAQWTGPLGGDWRRDYRVITDAVDRTVAPVHLGLFAEAKTVRRLLADYDPGAWALSVTIRDVIVHPMPPYVAVALGADAVRAVARSSAEALGGADTLATLGPVATYLRNRIREVTSVTATLGFDPLQLLSGYLRRSEEAVAVEKRAERLEQATE
jgi:hypothetical protein